MPKADLSTRYSANSNHAWVNIIVNIIIFGFFFHFSDVRASHYMHLLLLSLDISKLFIATTILTVGCKLIHSGNEFRELEWLCGAKAKKTELV